MNGILILAHGSRRQETDRILDSLVGKVMERTRERLVYPAYLQFSDRNLEAGIEHLVREGADRIKVVPMFLFDGIHVTQDIPAELEAARKKHPDVELKMCGYLGDDGRIADIIVDRINEVK